MELKEYKYSKINDLDNYEYNDSNQKIKTLLKNINHNEIDKSVYEPIARYGFIDDGLKYDFILDKNLKKITFRKDKINRYGDLILVTKSYEIAEEDGKHLLDVMF